MAFRFDAARWTTADRMAGSATLVVPADLASRPTLPLSHEQILGAAAGLNLLLVPTGMLIMPGGGSSLVKVSWDFGAFIGLAAVVVAVIPLATALLRARSGHTA